MKRLKLVLISLVILSGCEKKLNDGPLSGNEQELPGLNGRSTTNLVITPSAPPVSISEDLTVTNPLGSDITIITASDYNALDPKDQIFYTGLKNATQYFLQDPSNLNSALQFNADGSYSIVVNSSFTEDPATPGPGGSCSACDMASAFSCLRGIAIDMMVNHTYVVVATISFGGGGCLTIKWAIIKGRSVSNNTPIGGTVVETYTPPPTYQNVEFDSYINAVKFWGVSQGGGPTGGGPVSHPELWTREDLVGFIELYNNDSSHVPIDHQHDAEFQLQLEYYILFIMTDISIPIITP